MKPSRILIASAALALSVATTAQAQVVGSTTDGPIGPFRSLAEPGACSGTPFCTLGGVGLINGGTILESDQPFADIPAGTVFESRFLSVGPSTGNQAVILFNAGPLSSIGFLWGSPDTYNRLLVFHTGGGDGVQFTAAGLGFSETGGDQDFSQYVRFDAEPGFELVGLGFFNDPERNAFEVANFSTPIDPAQVPEPAGLSLLAAGLGMLGVVARRRRRA